MRRARRARSGRLILAVNGLALSTERDTLMGSRERLAPSGYDAKSHCCVCSVSDSGKGNGSRERLASGAEALRPG